MVRYSSDYRHGIDQRRTIHVYSRQRWLGSKRSHLSDTSQIAELTPAGSDKDLSAKQSITHDQEEIGNPSRPKGLRFAILFLSILAGDFFVGYDSSCAATLTTVASDEFSSLTEVG